jgi:TetR/AcrR family transcriptional regulator
MAGAERSGVPAAHEGLFKRIWGSDTDPDQETRGRILLAAASLFANRGYAGTAVREIVESAGVTKPTLYYYFKNKEDLYVRVLDHITASFRNLVDSTLSGPGSVRGRLLALFDSTYALFREQLDLVRLVYSVLYGPQGAAPAYDFHSEHVYLDQVVRDILLLGVEAGELRAENLEEALFMLLGMLDSMSCMLVMEPIRPPFSTQDIGRLIDLVFDGARGVLRPKEGNT